MTKITEAQRELLTQAAADPEGVVDMPEDAKIGRPLMKHGLAISLPVTGGGSRLLITTAGRALLGEADAASASQAAAEEHSPELKPNGGPEGPSEAASPPVSAGLQGEAGGEENTPADETMAPNPPKPPPGGKLGKLVELLQRPSGATLEEMVAATGWQAHSVRGAMSGGLKKKQGLTITSTKTDGTRVYRIVSGEAA